MAGEQSVSARRSITIGGLAIGGVPETISNGDTQQIFAQTIAAAQTNYAVAFPIDVSASVAQAIVANQDCTIKTHSTSAPDQTIALKANVPLLWASPEPTGRQVFTVDVTVIYVTTTPATTLQIGVAQNAAA